MRFFRLLINNSVTYLSSGYFSLNILLQRVALAERIWRERQVLRGLTDEELQDIGICRADAEQESVRGFWDLPEHIEDDLADKSRQSVQPSVLAKNITSKA